jgi:hypothetical protein
VHGEKAEPQSVERDLGVGEHAGRGNTADAQVQSSRRAITIGNTANMPAASEPTMPECQRALTFTIVNDR